MYAKNHSTVLLLELYAVLFIACCICRVTHVSTRRVKTGTYTISLSTGQYSICFDNSFSVVTTKTVEFFWQMPKTKPSSAPSVKTSFEYSLTELVRRSNIAAEHLHKLKQRTITSAAFADSLLYQVDLFSLLILVAVTIKAVAEIFCIRQFFRTKSTKC